MNELFPASEPCRGLAPPDPSRASATPGQEGAGTWAEDLGGQVPGGLSGGRAASLVSGGW